MQDKSRNKSWKLLARITVVVVLLLIVFAAVFHFLTKIHPPEISNNKTLEVKREIVDTHFYKIEDNWLRKSESGLW